MPRLIVLNGPPGIGKSTLARRYVEEHPLSLALEQDAVRGLLGGWRTRETESGRLARELCLDMARAHLTSGRDVIVPQFVAVPEYLDRLAAVAQDVGADHVECVLLDDVERAERRFLARRSDPLWSEHQRVAEHFIAAAGGYRHQYDRLLHGLAGRQVIRLTCVDGQVEATYAALLESVNRGSGWPSPAHRAP